MPVRSSFPIGYLLLTESFRLSLEWRVSRDDAAREGAAVRDRTVAGRARARPDSPRVRVGRARAPRHGSARLSGAARGETVSKETLLQEVWKGAFVVEAVIPKTLSALRAALGDDASQPTYVLTVPRRGYRLVAPVRWLEEPAGGDSGADRRSRRALPAGGAAESRGAARGGSSGGASRRGSAGVGGRRGETSGGPPTPPDLADARARSYRHAGLALPRLRRESPARAVALRPRISDSVGRLLLESA